MEFHLLVQCTCHVLTELTQLSKLIPFVAFAKPAIPAMAVQRCSQIHPFAHCPSSPITTSSVLDNNKNNNNDITWHDVSIDASSASLVVFVVRRASVGVISEVVAAHDARPTVVVTQRNRLSNLVSVTSDICGSSFRFTSILTCCSTTCVDLCASLTRHHLHVLVGCHGYQQT